MSLDPGCESDDVDVFGDGEESVSLSMPGPHTC